MSKLSAEIFLREGARQPSGANQPFSLHNPEMVWFVEAGRLDVFVVPTAGGNASGARRHCLQVQTGGVLLGLPVADEKDGLFFLAVGQKDCRIYQLEASRLKA